MGKNFVNKVGLVLVSLVFSLMPISSVEAAGSLGAAVEKSGQSSVAGDGDGETYCGPGADVLFANICDNVESLGAGAGETWTGVATITMHVKEGEGYFEGEADPLTHSTEFYFRDGFDDNTEPVSSRSDYVFAGWSFSEEAVTVDVEPGVTKAGEIDGDLYAVWSDKAYVFYHMINSTWEDPVYGNLYQDVVMEYNAGSTFQNLSPTPIPVQNVYDFAGWYEQMSAKGEHFIDGATVLDSLVTDVFTGWNYNADRIDDEMILDEVYDVTVGVSIPVYKFTAPETGMYEIYTDGIESGDTEEESYQGMIRVQDINDRTLAMEEQMDYPDGWGDVHLYYEMTAGETYFIRFLEAQGHYLRFNASIRRPRMLDVTFHANYDGAYFDGNPGQTTKVLSLPEGKDIKFKRLEELTYDTSEVSFGSWQLEEDDGRSYLLVLEENADVYAFYVDMISITLDYNGGYDPIDKVSTSTVAKFIPGTSFETPVDPDIADPDLDFVGWSRDPNATEPDEDIVEGMIAAEALKNETLYAVYGERAPVTFVTKYGAYMVDNPSITVYETSNAIGHIFYGMSVMHRNLNVKHVGWVDQDGVRTYQTDGIDPRYKIQGDTIFTAVLEYRFVADANGGVFPNGGIGGAERLAVQLPYVGEGTLFSYDAVIDRTGIPENDDPTKVFVGFATSEDATEPDIDDNTPIEGLSGIWAVWKDAEEEPDDDSDDGPVVPDADDTKPDAGIPESGIYTGENESATAMSFVGTAMIAVSIYGLFLAKNEKRI